MPGGQRTEGELSPRTFRRNPPPGDVPKRGGLYPRRISVAWLSIVTANVVPGELIFNENDSSLVYRHGSTIYRFDNAASRSI